MRAYNILIFSLIGLGAWELSGQRDRSALGRFAQGDSSYEYRRRVPTNLNSQKDHGDDLDDDSEEESELEELQNKGGLIIKGFPEGCAYATMNEPLPGQFLAFGRISFMGSSWAFEYMTQTRSGPFQIAEVAQNLGLIGQDPEQNLSVDLMARTSRENFVVAQLLDRSDLGLGPIVTCISPVFRGRLRPGRPVIFGQDYWTQYDRFIEYRRDPLRRNRWHRWQNRWREDGSQDWKRTWREKREHRDKHPRPLSRPRPNQQLDQNPKSKPPKPDKNKSPESILKQSSTPATSELRPRTGLDGDRKNRRIPKINKSQKIELEDTSQDI